MIHKVIDNIHVRSPVCMCVRTWRDPCIHFRFIVHPLPVKLDASIDFLPQYLSLDLFTSTLNWGKNENLNAALGVIVELLRWTGMKVDSREKSWKRRQPGNMRSASRDELISETKTASFRKCDRQKYRMRKEFRGTRGHQMCCTTKKVSGGNLFVEGARVDEYHGSVGSSEIAWLQSRQMTRYRWQFITG